MNQHRPFSLKVRLRRNRMKTGQTSFTNQSETIDQHSQPVQETSRTIHVESVEKTGSSSTIINAISEVENTDPEKLHIRLPRKIGRIRRWFSHQKTFWKPEPTAAELEQMEIRRRTMRIFRAMLIHDLPYFNPCVCDRRSAACLRDHREGRARRLTRKPTKPTASTKASGTANIGQSALAIKGSALKNRTTFSLKGVGGNTKSMTLLLRPPKQYKVSLFLRRIFCSAVGFPWARRQAPGVGLSLFEWRFTTV